MSIMTQPKRSSSVRLMCFLAAANLTIAGSLKDDEVEVVTLGALHPPLVSPVRPSGSGHAEAPLDRGREESPDETIARLLRHMFERESQQLLLEEHKDLQADRPPAAADDDDDAPATAEAEHHPVRTDGSNVSPEGEMERNFPRGVDAAEVGQEERPNQQQAADMGGSGTSSTPDTEVSPQGLVGTDSDSEDDGGRVEAGAAGFSNDAGADRVEGESVRDASDPVDGEETSGDPTTAAASEAGDAPGSRYVLLKEPEDEEVQYARRKEGALHEMSLGKSPNGGLEAAVSLVGEGEGAKVSGPGAFAELEEDGGTAREQEAAAAGLETEGKETGTDAGVEGGETNCGTAAHTVGLGTELGEQAAVEGELEAGAASALSHDTPPTAVIPGIDGQHAGAVEEGDEFESIASAATAKDGAAAATPAAEGTRVDETGVVPGVEFVAGTDDLVDEAPALLSDVVDEEMGVAAVGHVSLGEASFLGIDGDEDEGANKEDAVPAAGVTPAMVSVEDDGKEEQDIPERGDEMSVLESSGDSAPVQDERSSPRFGTGHDVQVAAGAEEGEVGFRGQQLATNSTSSESPAGEEDGTDFRPPEERRAAPAGEVANDDDLVESPALSENRAARQDELPEAPQADSEASVAAGEAGDASGVEEGGPPRPRPVFRFVDPSGPEVDLGMVGKITTTMLRDAENEDGVIAFPPLPPIDALPESGAKGDGGAGAAGEAEGGGGGGWWGAWGGKLGTAAREKMSRWASEAADRGGVLAKRLMKECVARVRRGWHETIEPQTEFARRRLEGVAEFCMAEVADHLADPVLAEAL